MSRQGRKVKKVGKKSGCDGDVSIADFANSTTAPGKGKPGKAKSSLLNLICDANTSPDDQCTEGTNQQIENKKQQTTEKKGKNKSTKSKAQIDGVAKKEEIDQYKLPNDLRIRGLEEKLGNLNLILDDQSTKGKKKQIDDEAMKEEEEQIWLIKELLIHGLKETPGENTKAKVVQMFQNCLEQNIKSNNIVLAERRGEPKPTGQHRIIVVTFKKYCDREIVFYNKKKLKGSGVMITEHLTPQRLELFHIVRKLFGAENSWSQDGTVFWIDNKGKRCSAKRKADLKFSYLDL